MATPYLIADSAQVTVLRSLASTAFGKYGLKLPEGVDLEDVYEVAAPGNELAYVSSLGSKRRVGGMFRRFVRADVNVTAQGEGMVPASDVERVLDEAAKRVSGDFFLESDISKAGLGPWVPFVDFHVGDIANVEIWGRVVPLVVTRIEPKRTEHSDNDWSVHVGGQLLSDSEARLAENADIYNAVVSDRRDIAGVEAKASQAAAASSSAQSTADTARGEVAAVRDTLAGEQSGEPDLLSQLVAVNEELQRLGQSPQPSLMLAFVALSTALWQAQEQINETNARFREHQEVLNAQFEAQDAAALLRHDQIVEQMRDLQAASLKSTTEYSLLGGDGASDEHWERTSAGLVARGGWTGTGVITAFERRISGVIGKRRVSIPQDNGSRVYNFADFSLDAGGWAEVTFSLDAGEQKKWATSTGAGTAGSGVWATHDTLFIPQGGQKVVINFSVTFANAHRGAKYEIRVIDGAGRQLGSSLYSTAIGPLTALGSGRATLSQTVSLDALAGGQTLSFQSACSHSGASQRAFSSSKGDVSLIAENI